MVTEMTKLSQNESRLMVKLSEKTSRDADIVKTLTLLALIYLPASFVSVSLLRPISAPYSSFIGLSKLIPHD